MICGTIALMITIPMVFIWAEGSRGTIEFMAQDGKTLLAGWIHALYMWAMITIVLLFYFATPFRLVGSTVAGTVTILLAIHVAIGLIQPPYATHGRLPPPGVYLQIVWAWIALLGAWWYLIHRK
jgi:hypothetical protein